MSCFYNIKNKKKNSFNNLAQKIMKKIIYKKNIFKCNLI